MRKSQRDYLSRSAIDQRVNSMLSVLFGDSLDLKKPAQLSQIVEILTTQNWIHFSDEADLGKTANGNKVRGLFTVNPNAILICSSLERWGAEYRFVLAHEIGHLALHRKMIGKGKYIDRADMPADTAEELKYRDKATLSDLGWVEWQANEFAISLVLPKVYLLNLVVTKQLEMGINKNLGTIYFDDQRQNEYDAKQIVGFLAEKFCIKDDLIWSRLRSLKILQDHRKKEIEVAYDCLRGLFYSEQDNSTQTK